MLDDRNEFKLKSFTIELKEFGEHNGKYLSSIKFGNGHYESFTVNIPSNVAGDIVQLILSAVHESASACLEGIVHQLQLQADLGEQNEEDSTQAVV